MEKAIFTDKSNNLKELSTSLEGVPVSLSVSLTRPVDFFSFSLFSLFLTNAVEPYYK